MMGQKMLGRETMTKKGDKEITAKGSQSIGGKPVMTMDGVCKK